MLEDRVWSIDDTMGGYVRKEGIKFVPRIISRYVVAKSFMENPSNICLITLLDEDSPI